VNTMEIHYRPRVASVIALWIFVVFMIGLTVGSKPDPRIGETTEKLLLTGLLALAIVRTAWLRRAPLRLGENELVVPRTFFPGQPRVIPVDSIHRVARRVTRYGNLHMDIYHGGGMTCLQKRDFRDANAFSWMFDYLSWRIVHRVTERFTEPRTLQSSSEP